MTDENAPKPDSHAVTSPADSKGKDLRIGQLEAAFGQVYMALEPLDQDKRHRVMRAVCVLLRIPPFTEGG